MTSWYGCAIAGPPGSRKPRKPNGWPPDPRRRRWDGGPDVPVLPADAEGQRGRRVGVVEDLYRTLVVHVVIGERVGPVVDPDRMEVGRVVVPRVGEVVLRRVVPIGGVQRHAPVERGTEVPAHLTDGVGTALVVAERQRT